MIDTRLMDGFWYLSCLCVHGYGMGEHPVSYASAVGISPIVFITMLPQFGILQTNEKVNHKVGQNPLLGTNSVLSPHCGEIVRSPLHLFLSMIPRLKRRSFPCSCSQLNGKLELIASHALCFDFSFFNGLDIVVPPRIHPSKF
jgi:hypothetical protein